jgi:hypothetical protein
VSPAARLLLKDVEQMTSQLLIELGQLERGLTGDTAVSPALLCRMVKRKVERYSQRVDAACDRYSSDKG